MSVLLLQLPAPPNYAFMVYAVPLPGLAFAYYSYRRRESSDVA